MNKFSVLKELRQFLSPITEVDSRNQDWQQQVKTTMENYGFVTLGAGKMGITFSHPSIDYIVKIFMQDVAFLLWANFAKEHQHNPYVPKIRGKAVRITPLFMAIRIEKLEESGYFQYEEFEKNCGLLEHDKDYIPIAEFREKYSMLDDVNCSNIMWRGNQEVLTDPFYNWYVAGQYTLDPYNTSGLNSILVRA